MKKFYGQFNPPVDQFIFERYFPDQNMRGIFVECGAFDGLTECSCKFFEETMQWKGYNLEPAPWIYEKLCENRPHSNNLNYALSNTIGDATFKAVDHPQFGKNCTNGSLSHTEAHSKLLEEIGCEIVEVSVKLTTWVDFVIQENITHVDLLVLDVEGHELSVIEGMQGTSVLPDVICIEVGHLNFDDIRKSLSTLDYVYDISSHVNAYFVKQEKLSLFALRSSIFWGRKILEQSECQSTIDRIQTENKLLREHVVSLENSLFQIKQSKTWRLIKILQGFKIIGRY